MTRRVNEMRGRVVPKSLLRLLVGAVLFSAVALPVLRSEAPSEEPAPADAVEAAGPTDDATLEPSDDMIVGFAEEWAEFPERGVRTLTGNVRITRPDGYLNADKVTMYYDPDDPDRVVQKTIAEGNVSLKEGTVVATCDKAVFTENNNLMELTGNVVVLEGENRMESERFTYDRRTGERHGSGGVMFRVKISTPEEEPAEGDGTEAADASEEAASEEKPEASDGASAGKE